jgi:predicted DNA-binding transcriptional regulator YafY
MKLIDNIFKLDRLLHAARRPVSLVRVMDKLQCSRRTAIRTINVLRDLLGAPIEHRRESSSLP